VFRVVLVSNRVLEILRFARRLLPYLSGGEKKAAHFDHFSTTIIITFNASLFAHLPFYNHVDVYNSYYIDAESYFDPHFYEKSFKKRVDFNNVVDLIKYGCTGQNGQNGLLFSPPESLFYI